jgi:hypothetical protein
MKPRSAGHLERCFAAFSFERFVEADDRTAALVKFHERKYFPTQSLLLLPYTKDADYFAIEEASTEILSVWTFDGSNLEGKQTVNLKSQWPKNILDKAGITPSREVASRWSTGRAV